ncbi:hypothetical protein L211DRAFT_858866 [Terfezia boudieri ATCC MYA-4762]|uniref:Uncharacterized protein n=1 Tax=Terfezia boudieri ATCC MYA-4762 TaxID=1051890 RepID=A0A3N4LQB4_9PEZI|nr:hypothetical protein L211DRAFT_858866 [Terfezia boudieri ATCC MYA-4762]
MPNWSIGRPIAGWAALLSVFLILNKIIRTGSIFRTTSLIILTTEGERKTITIASTTRRNRSNDSIFLSQMDFLGFSLGSALAFRQYVLSTTGNDELDGWQASKVIVLMFIVFCGFAVLNGHLKIDKPITFRIPYLSAWTWVYTAPLTIGGVMTLYFLANVAYFTAIPKSYLANSSIIVTDSAGARELPALVAISNIRTVLAVSFAHACGEAFKFIVDLYTYPRAWINMFVAAGLIYLHWNCEKEQWDSPWHSTFLVNVIYMILNLFLVVSTSYQYYVSLRLWGGLWTKLLQCLGGYKVVSERRVLEDGSEVMKYRKVKLG